MTDPPHPRTARRRPHPSTANRTGGPPCVAAARPDALQVFQSASTACATHPDSATADRTGWLTTQEAAVRFGLSRVHVDRLCGWFPEIAVRKPSRRGRWGYRLLVDPSALARVLALPRNQRRPPEKRNRPRPINPKIAALRARMAERAPREGEITAGEAMRRLGVSRQRISQLCMDLPGFATRKTHGNWLISEVVVEARRKRRPPRPRAREAGDARK